MSTIPKGGGSANVTPITTYAHAIADVFKVLTERELGHLPNGTVNSADMSGNIKDLCLVVAHCDTNHPSASYNVKTNVWNCFTCEQGGGIRELVVAAGIVGSAADATGWLRDQGLQQPVTLKWEDTSARYNYLNEAGTTMYQVGRWQLPDGGKDFRQRAPKPGGGWIASLKGVVRVPCNLKRLLETAAAGGTRDRRAGSERPHPYRSTGLRRP